MIRFKVEVYGRHKLGSGEWGRVMTRTFYMTVLDDDYELTTKESYTPITSLDRNVADQIFGEHTTILTERFFNRPFTEYRVTREF